VFLHLLAGEEVPSTQPSKDEVALSVHAIGLNRAESIFMHGYYLEPTQLPAKLALQASGIVSAVRPNVDDNWLNKPVSTIPAFSFQFLFVGWHQFFLAAPILN
jgi:NADPH:quinone reductase-like Zn-dependent oxidoreductase